jgi:hypothetical protein
VSAADSRTALLTCSAAPDWTRPTRGSRRVRVRDRLLGLASDVERRTRIELTPDQQRRRGDARQQVTLVGGGHHRQLRPEALGANSGGHLRKQRDERRGLRTLGVDVDPLVPPSPACSAGPAPRVELSTSTVLLGAGKRTQAGTDDHISVCRAAASRRIGATRSASMSPGEQKVIARRYRPSPSRAPRGSASSAPL